VHALRLKIKRAIERVVVGDRSRPAGRSHTNRSDARAVPAPHKPQLTVRQISNKPRATACASSCPGYGPLIVHHDLFSDRKWGSIRASTSSLFQK
jgi:hypothetical protein